MPSNMASWRSHWARVPAGLMPASPATAAMWTRSWGRVSDRRLTRSSTSLACSSEVRTAEDHGEDEAVVSRPEARASRSRARAPSPWSSAMS